MKALQNALRSRNVEAFAALAIFIIALASFPANAKLGAESTNASAISATPGKPDLTITYLYAFANSTSNQTNSTNTSLVFIYVVTKNIGEIGVNSQTTTQIEIPGVATLDINIPPLKAGQSNIWAGTLNLVIQPGSYVVIARADSADAVQELNEHNNEAYSNFTVS